MMETASKIVPKEEEVSQEVMDINGQAKALKIIDSKSYISAGELWKAIKELRKKVDETFSPIISAAFQAHKTAVAKKKEVDIPLEEAEKTVKQAMSAWDVEQERIRLAEQHRLEEIARKEEENRLLQEAIDAEKNGEHEEAEAIIEQPTFVPPVILPKTTPKIIGGPIYRENWKARVVNEKLLPREMLIPDFIKLNQLARALKKQFNVPGAEAYSERV